MLRSKMFGTAKSFFVGKFQPFWYTLSSGHKFLAVSGMLAIGVIGSLLLLSQLSTSFQNFGTCGEPAQDDLKLPVAVMAKSCRVTLKPEQEKNFATVAGFTQLAGVRDNSYFFVTEEPKEKITQYYQQQLKNKGFRVDPANPGNAIGVKFSLAGISSFMVTSFTPQQAAQLVEGNYDGKNIYSITWFDGNFSDIAGR